MAEVGMYEAKTHFPKLVARVQKGETITITKHGVPVAVIGPPAADAARKMTPSEAIAEIKRLRASIAARGVRVSKEEIKEWINEGRR